VLSCVRRYRCVAKRLGATNTAIIMSRNGLYAISSKVLDGVEGGATGISVLHDGTMRGGGSTYYHVGSYSCSGSQWKGEVTTRHPGSHYETVCTKGRHHWVYRDVYR
jgi:hypothetical protein